MGFDRSVSPSSSMKRYSLQSDADDNEENNNHQMFENMPKKPNYMSSTISASSKAITPKKKIFASEPILDNALDPFSLQEPRSPQMVVSRFSPSKEEFDSSEPYDPLTNFLSPRPQFLRYDPNRRRETEDGFLRRSGSSSMSLIDGEICSLTEDEDEEEEEEIKGANEEIEESDNHEIGEEFKVGTKTWLLILIFVLFELFVIYANCTDSYCGFSLQNDGVESDHYGTRNCSLESVSSKNELERAFERGNRIKEVMEWHHKITDSLDSIEVTEVDDLGKEFEPTVSDIGEEKEEEEEEEEEGGLETDESLESYGPTLLEDQLETEFNPNEESQTMVDGLVSESPIMVKARTLIVKLMRTEAEFALKVFIGAVTFFTIVACYFLGSNSKPNMNRTFAAEDHTSEVCSLEKRAPEKVNEESYKTKAPSVGFLSEFVVTKSHNSPSYGSYSAQVKTPKKLAGGEGSTIMTPVRRSSRIRSLSIKSL